MERQYELFLQALRAALRSETLDWDDVSPEEMENVIALAQEHHVLPMIFEAVYDSPSAKAMDGWLYAHCRRGTVQSVMAQSMKTTEFLELSQGFRQAGVRPLVVKGIVCRNLYPNPDYRLSGDEDVFCGEDQFKACHKVMIDLGMEPSAPDLDDYEVPYRKCDGALYIELHKSLFARKSDVFGGCNDLFDDAFSRAVEIEIQGQKVATMGHTDHMLYLIVHAFKHFLHSGFGIRQVCDMGLFANAYGAQIDWAYVLEKLRALRAEKFAAALFEIARKYLVFSPEQACYPDFWREIQVEEEALLADLLYGGIYGSSDRSRVHSSNMTLDAVAKNMQGKKVRRGLLRTVFPSAKSIENRFPYLHRHPWLLPVAWSARIFGYAKESVTDPNSAAGDVIRTGSQRIELLRRYDIID